MTVPPYKPLKDVTGKTIEEITIKIVHQQKTLWEQKLRLHMRPKPAWMPPRLWAHIVGLVLVQSEQRLK